MNSSSSAHQCSGLRLQRETEEAYIYVVDAPGMKSEHVQMTLEQTDRNATVIHLRDGRRKKEEESPSPNNGSKPPPRFHRLLSLRSNVDADRIDACVIDGVLSITVPKLSRQEQAAEPSNNICLQMTRRTAKAQ
ncbi:unnamed protein product [Cylindrotheca closterium]|uniref:SHSP domain-containing protein n=1 Tax=Cylindrotheca closterium TaxID=2856 RepID=A0AAD2JN20_9STRA|nr:unnamed protein product [Cylindrotheca closterium]